MTFKEIIREYSELLLIAAVVLVLLLLAAWLSPAPREQLGYLQYFFMTLATIYVPITLLVLVVLGFLVGVQYRRGWVLRYPRWAHGTSYFTAQLPSSRRQ